MKRCQRNDQGSPASGKDLDSWRSLFPCHMMSHSSDPSKGQSPSSLILLLHTDNTQMLKVL